MGHGCVRPSAVRGLCPAHRISRLVGGNARHPRAGCYPRSGRRAWGSSLARRVGPARTSTRRDRRQDGGPLLWSHARPGVRIRSTIRWLLPRPSPGDVGGATGRALARRSVARRFAPRRPSVSALTLRSAQAPDPTSPDPHHLVVASARLRPGGDIVCQA